MCRYLKFIAFISYISIALATQCIEPKISDSNTYVTKDAKINTETSYVVEFRLKCSNYAKNVLLYTEVGGNLLASSSNEAGDKYQFSWTESHKTARTGRITVRIFDEDGFTELKRAQRNNEDLSKVKSLGEITFNFGGAHKGPFIQYELVVAALFSGIFYWAFKERSNIQA